MRVDEHGGGCCGVNHIYNFDNSTIDDLDEALREVCTTTNPNRLAEVVLSERQVTGHNHEDDRIPECVRNAGGWPAVLARRGFRLVSRWRNSNSGRNCYLFVMVPTNLSLVPRNLPFPWTHERDVPIITNGVDVPVPPPAVVPPGPVPIVYRYHNVLRSGRSNAGWVTREQAQAAAPRAQRIDRCTFMSNGELIWTEGV